MNPERVLMRHRRRCCWCIDSWYVRRTLVGAGCASGAGTVAAAGGRRPLQLGVAGGSSRGDLQWTIRVVLALVASNAARWCLCINRLQWTCFGAGSVCAGAGGVAFGYSTVPLIHQQQSVTCSGHTLVMVVWMLLAL
jgi:hypothetical protein